MGCIREAYGPYRIALLGWMHTWQAHYSFKHIPLFGVNLNKEEALSLFGWLVGWAGISLACVKTYLSVSGPRLDWQQCLIVCFEVYFFHRDWYRILVDIGFNPTLTGMAGFLH